MQLNRIDLINDGELLNAARVPRSRKASISMIDAKIT